MTPKRKRLWWVLPIFVFLGINTACSTVPFKLESVEYPDGPSEESVQPPSFPTIDQIEEVVQPTSIPTTRPIEIVPTPTASPPQDRMVFGSEIHINSFQKYGHHIVESGLELVRLNGLNWQSIELNEGEHQWQTTVELDEELVSVSASGMSTILIVRGTPEWAQLVPGSACGPIKPEKMEAFAAFMVEAVSKYSAPPYNIKYWEMGNEPDVDPSLVSRSSVFGCWGNLIDPFYGGGYYAEMLKAVYPAIKGVDPEAQVLIGGLLLDCDPTQPPEGADCTPGKFLEGILENGGGEFFDMVSFHGYAPYFGPESGFPNELYFDEHHPGWEHRGGVVIGKVDFLREVMAGYNFDKPIFHTEGALLCSEKNPTDCAPPGEQFYVSQADYAVRMFVRNWANDVSGTIWYEVKGPGWRYSGLFDENLNPKPVYRAINFLTTILSKTAYVGENKEIEGLEWYEFSSPEKRILVLWSTEQVDIPIQIPDSTIMIYDKLGNEVITSGGELIINSPIYLEISPK